MNPLKFYHIIHRDIFISIQLNNNLNKDYIFTITTVSCSS